MEQQELKDAISCLWFDLWKLMPNAKCLMPNARKISTHSVIVKEQFKVIKIQGGPKIVNSRG